MPHEPETRLWAIVSLSDINAADVTTETQVAGETRVTFSNEYIDSCIQTSKETLRLSVDGANALLKWEGQTPSILDSAEKYTHSEILNILETPAWTDPEPEP